MEQPNPSNGDVTRVLGLESDAALRAAVLRALKGLGAESFEHTWGVAGSQELETLRCRVDGRLVTVEAETYMGLAITGPARILDRIGRALARWPGGADAIGLDETRDRDPSARLRSRRDNRDRGPHVP